MTTIHDKLKPHSERLIEKIEIVLNARGFSYQRPESIAAAVMKQSDFYAKYPEKSTPWHEPWCQVAYIAYYLPLNWWRLATACARGQEVGFFKDWEQFIDFGSGLGSASIAFQTHEIDFKGGGLCIETSRQAIAIHQELHKLVEDGYGLTWQQSGPKSSQLSQATLAVFSYSFTELQELPVWASQCGGLMIVEPATKDDGRRLLKVRQELIDKGWHIAAPCTHQGSCPLLSESERDWCHDRAQWHQPPELLALEQHMPIKNGTLPFSFLMATKIKSGSQPFGENLARATGDLQEFKGFAKQLICRRPEREFIAWQKRDFKKSEYPQIPRGSLLSIKDDIEKKGNELRPTSIQAINCVSLCK